MIAHLAVSAYGDHGLLTAVILGVVTVTLFFLCAVVHAGGHLVVARFAGQAASSRIFVFGDILKLPPLTARTGLLIAAAGPAVSAFLGGGLLFGSTFAEGVTADVLTTTAFANFALAGVNLLPGLPLDGGRAVELLAGSTHLAVRAGRTIAVLAAIAGAWLLLREPGVLDDTALGLWLILAGAFVFLYAKPPTVQTPARLPDVEKETAGAWARAFIGRVDADDEVPAIRGPYAVSDNGRLAGVLPADASHGARVADVMVPWSPTLGVRSTAPLAEALERLADQRTPIVVIVDDKGVVRGVLDEAGVRARLAGV